MTSAAGRPALRRDARANLERLVAAAVEVFRDKGFCAPLEDVARAAGVSIGTLYNRFGTREALIDAVAPVIAAERTAGLAARARAQPDPWARFRFYLVGMIELQAASPPVDDMMAGRYPASQGLTEQCAEALGHAARFIAEAQADGSLRPDFSPADVTALFLATSGILRGATASGDEMWRRHLDYVLDGLRVRRPD